jgi:hypothetical protein
MLIDWNLFTNLSSFLTFTTSFNEEYTNGLKSIYMFLYFTVNNKGLGNNLNGTLSGR